MGKKLPIRHSVTREPRDQSRIRFMAVENPNGGGGSRPIRKSAMAISAARHDVLLGPIFGGHRDAILRFAVEHAKAVDAFLEEGVVSDDQDLYLYLYQRKPEIFDVVESVSGWNGLFVQF